MLGYLLVCCHKPLEQNNCQTYRGKITNEILKKKSNIDKEANINVTYTVGTYSPKVDEKENQFNMIISN